MSLHNHSILIIDEEIDAFVTALHVVLVDSKGSLLDEAWRNRA